METVMVVNMCPRWWWWWRWRWHWSWSWWRSADSDDASGGGHGHGDGLETVMVDVVAETEVEVGVITVEVQVTVEVLGVTTTGSPYLAPGTVLISTLWPLSHQIILAAIVISILQIRSPSFRDKIWTSLGGQSCLGQLQVELQVPEHMSLEMSWQPSSGRTAHLGS